MSEPKEKTVLVTGCFDVIHRGHVALLARAGELGRVVVGINDDHSVHMLKGPGRPVNTIGDRLFVVESFQWVAYAFQINSMKVTNAILQVRPDFWVKGGDWTLATLDKEEVAAANDVGAQIRIFPLTKGYSTTETLKRLEGK